MVRGQWRRAVYLALGVTREVLGLWIAEQEGAKFWLSVMNELRNRGVQGLLIAVVDGLKGFPEAITAVRRANQFAELFAGPPRSPRPRFRSASCI